MGLKKNIEQPTGVVITYLNIFSYQHYCAEKRMHVTVNGYISEEARKDNKQPAFVWGVAIELEGENEVVDPTRAWIYEKLKTNELFADAEDDL